MTHKYPAVLPPQAVERIELAVEAHRHALVEAYVNVEKYKRQADEMSERLNREREAHEQTRGELEQTTKAYEYERQIRIIVMRRRDKNRRWARAWKERARHYRSAFDTADLTSGIRQAKLAAAERLLGETHLALTETERQLTDKTTE